MNMKKFSIIICVLLLGQTISADDIRDSFKLMEWASQLLEQAAKSSKSENAKKIQEAARVMVSSARVAQKAVEFKNDLPTISEKAKLLNARLNCFDHIGQGQCSTADMGCATEELCAAKVLQALVELLDPLIKDLLGYVEKGKKEATPGALLSLVQIIPDKNPTRIKYENTLKEYIATANTALKYIRSIVYSLEPYELAVQQIAADTSMQPAEKEAFEEIIHDEPIEIADEPVTGDWE